MAERGLGDDRGIVRSRQLGGQRTPREAPRRFLDTACRVRRRWTASVRQAATPRQLYPRRRPRLSATMASGSTLCNERNRRHAHAGGPAPASSGRTVPIADGLGRAGRNPALVVAVASVTRPRWRAASIDRTAVWADAGFDGGRASRRPAEKGTRCGDAVAQAGAAPATVSGEAAIRARHWRVLLREGRIARRRAASQETCHHRPCGSWGRGAPEERAVACGPPCRSSHPPRPDRVNT